MERTGRRGQRAEADLPTLPHPAVKRTPLTRRTPMPRGDSTLARMTRLKPRSAKRQQVAPQRAEVVRQMLTEHPHCQIRWDDGCTGWAVDVDEVLSRAQGGSILDPTNLQTGCRYCHDQKHAHPDEAAARGLTIRRRKDMA